MRKCTTFLSQPYIISVLAGGYCIIRLPRTSNRARKGSRRKRPNCKFATGSAAFGKSIITLTILFVSVLRNRFLVTYSIPCNAQWSAFRRKRKIKTISQDRASRRFQSDRFNRPACRAIISRAERQTPWSYLIPSSCIIHQPCALNRRCIALARASRSLARWRETS